MSWNPSGPSQAGFEWPVWRQGGVRLNRDDVTVGAVLTSTVAETVDRFAIYCDAVSGVSRVRAEVYDPASIPSVTESRYDADGDVDVGAWSASGAATISAAVSDGSDSDYASLSSYSDGSDAHCHLNVDTSALPAAAQVQMVRLRARFQMSGADTDRQATVWLFSQTTAGSVSLPADGSTVEHVREWTSNPQTGEAWTPAEVHAFQSAEVAGFWANALGSGVTGRCLQWWMEVVYDDTILVAGAMEPEDGWNTLDLDDDWSKPSSGEFLVVLRRESGQGESTVRSLDDAPEGRGSRPVTLDGGAVVAAGDRDGSAFPVVPVRTDGASSVDGQPYATLERSPVHDGQTVIETVDLDGSARRNVRVVVARQSSATTEPLTVSLGGTQGTVQVADVDDAVRKLREVTVVLDSTVSPSGNTDITLTCDAPDGQGWEAVRLSTEGEHTDAAWGDGQDVPVLVTGAPDPVSGVGAT